MDNESHQLQLDNTSLWQQIQASLTKMNIANDIQQNNIKQIKDSKRKTLLDFEIRLIKKLHELDDLIWEEANNQFNELESLFSETQDQFKDIFNLNNYTLEEVAKIIQETTNPKTLLKNQNMSSSIQHTLLQDLSIHLQEIQTAKYSFKEINIQNFRNVLNKKLKTGIESISFDLNQVFSLDKLIEHKNEAQEKFNKEDKSLKQINNQKRLLHRISFDGIASLYTEVNQVKLRQYKYFGMIKTSATNYLNSSELLKNAKVCYEQKMFERQGCAKKIRKNLQFVFKTFQNSSFTRISRHFNYYPRKTFICPRVEIPIIPRCQTLEIFIKNHSDIDKLKIRHGHPCQQVVVNFNGKPNVNFIQSTLQYLFRHLCQLRKLTVNSKSQQYVFSNLQNQIELKGFSIFQCLAKPEDFQSLVSLSVQVDFPQNKLKLLSKIKDLKQIQKAKFFQQRGKDSIKLTQLFDYLRLPKSVKNLEFAFYKFPSKPNEALFSKFLDHLKSLVNLNSFKILNYSRFTEDVEHTYAQILRNLPHNVTSLHSNIKINQSFEKSKPLLYRLTEAHLPLSQGKFPSNIGQTLSEVQNVYFSGYGIPLKHQLTSLPLKFDILSIDRILCESAQELQQIVNDLLKLQDIKEFTFSMETSEYIDISYSLQQYLYKWKSLKSFKFAIYHKNRVYIQPIKGHYQIGLTSFRNNKLRVERTISSCKNLEYYKINCPDLYLKSKGNSKRIKNLYECQKLRIQLPQYEKVGDRYLDHL